MQFFALRTRGTSGQGKRCKSFHILDRGNHELDSSSADKVCSMAKI